MRIAIVNDALTQIPGSRTLWHDLVDWLGGTFVGDVPFSELAQKAAAFHCDLLIRNGSYAPPFDLPVPQISLFQDILTGAGRKMQLEVMKGCTPIFNSSWTQAQFPEAGERGRVIPLPIDFDLFRPLPDRDALREKWDILPDSVCWIGAYSHIKGWDILLTLIEETDFNWCIVVKDEVPFPPKAFRKNARVFSRLPQSDLVEVINACSVGLCTSRVETQHLAGLEMGACGLPLVTTPVGAYYGRDDGPWGMAFDTSVKLAAALKAAFLNKWWKKDARAYWLTQGFDRASCEKAWREVVEDAVAVRR